MRTRNRTIINDSVSLDAQLVHFAEDDSPGIDYTVNLPATTVYTNYVDEWMADVDTGNRRNPNSVDHRKQSVRIFAPTDAWYIEASNPGHVGRATYFNRPNQWFVASRQILGSVPWDPSRRNLPSRLSLSIAPIDEEILLSDLMERASGQIADHVLNLSELHELPSALKSLNLWSSLSSYNWNKFRNAMSGRLTAAKSLKVIGDSVKSIPGWAANAHLAYKFGIAPLIVDINKTYRFVKNSHEKLSKYAKDKPIRVSKAFPIGISFDNSSIGLGAPSGDLYRWQGFPVLSSSLGEVRYVLLLEPRLSGIRGLLGPMNDMLNRFGPSGPSAFAWEKVPFSFVVDWFVDLRSVLRGFDTLFGVNPFNVLGFTKSITWQALVNVSATHRDSLYGTIKHWDAAEFKWQGYERVVLHPKISPRLKIRFGKNQLLLSTSLLTQFILGLSRRGKQ